MACNGNCGACATPCSVANIIQKMSQRDGEKSPECNKNNPSNLQKQECKEKMSESTVKVAGCGAPSEPEQIRANAAIIALQRENEELKQQLKTAGASTPLCFGIKHTTCFAFILAAIALGVAIYALATVSKCTAVLQYANKASQEAVSIANKAITKAENAEVRAENNYIFMRGAKQK